MNSVTIRPLADRPAKVLLSMAFAALAALAGAARAGAAPSSDNAPHLAIRYEAASLSSESGTRALYRRLVKAAAEVCPVTSIDHPFLSRPVSQCREQAIAGAVHDIGNVRLAALHASSSKRG